MVYVNNDKEALLVMDFYVDPLNLERIDELHRLGLYNSICNNVLAYKQLTIDDFVTKDWIWQPNNDKLSILPFFVSNKLTRCGNDIIFSSIVDTKIKINTMDFTLKADTTYSIPISSLYYSNIELQHDKIIHRMLPLFVINDMLKHPTTVCIGNEKVILWKGIAAKES